MGHAGFKDRAGYRLDDGRGPRSDRCRPEAIRHRPRRPKGSGCTRRGQLRGGDPLFRSGARAASTTISRSSTSGASVISAPSSPRRHWPTSIGSIGAACRPRDLQWRHLPARRGFRSRRRPLVRRELRQSRHRPADAGSRPGGPRELPAVGVPVEHAAERDRRTRWPGAVAGAYEGLGQAYHRLGQDIRGGRGVQPGHRDRPDRPERVRRPGRRPGVATAVR